MASLKSVEKRKLEKLFEMNGGYVLDFTNRTFYEFVFDTTELNIYDEKYYEGSGSKAYRLRAFWNKESSYAVGKLIDGFLEYFKEQVEESGTFMSSQQAILFGECKKISERLLKGESSENVETIYPNSDDKDFELVAKLVRESIEKDEPQVALDRLHTFVTRFVRELCDKHSIQYSPNTPLHSLFGMYVKYLRGANLVESAMGEYILVSSISLLENFNSVRNNKSLAHGNSVLNYEESYLVFNSVANLVRFIKSVEPKVKSDYQRPKEEIDIDDIPF